MAVKVRYGDKKRAALSFLSFLQQEDIQEEIQRSNLQNIYFKQFIPQSDLHVGVKFSDALHLLTRLYWIKRTETDVLQLLNKKERNVYRTKCVKNKKQKFINDVEGIKPRSSRVSLDQHLSVGKNNVEVLLQGLSPEGSESGQDVPGTDGSTISLPEFVKVSPGGRQEYVCVLCNARCIDVQRLTSHMNGRRHRVAVLTRILKVNKKYLIQNKNGVKITSRLTQERNDSNAGESGSDDAHVVTEVEENKKQVVLFTITNTSTTDLLFFHKCEMLRRVRVFQLDDEHKVAEGKGSHHILPGETYEVEVHVLAKYIGTYAVPMAFMFSHENNPSKKTHIVRYVHANCHNDLIRQLQPTTPFKHPPRKSLKRPDLEEVDGFRVPKNSNQSLKHEIELENYRVPGGLRLALNQGLQVTDKINKAESKQIRDIRKRLTQPLTMANHMDKLSLLLHIEEIQMEVDIRKYDMESVSMATCKENKRLLTLKVPGLMEKRPSVLRGDWLFVRRHHGDTGPGKQEYKGFVHNVQRDEVQLGFSSRLVESFISGQKFDVRFVYNRFPIRLQHRAVQLAAETTLDDLLFPTATTICTRGLIQDTNSTLRFYDRKLETNDEQRRAVQNIVAGTSRPAPYLVFGPPGTGKTVTIVEAMKQIHKCIPKSHILACAPSNSAADLLASRLRTHMISKTDIFRINADSRNPSTIPEDVKECSNYNSRNKEFYFPCKEDLLEYRIIVTTMVSAGRLASANFPPGHFTHIFLDEAGHAVEAEALIAVAGILDLDKSVQDGAQLVLAGDPKQLGLVLRSPVAKQQGLELSLLERLMDKSQVFSRNKDAKSPDENYDSRLVTKLVRNYRSHPDILHIPNVTFYDSDLQVYADKLVRESLCSWEELPKKGFPLIFHGIVGSDQREERSPSFFNPEEVAVVLKYVEKVLSTRSTKTIQKEIGIISPYRKQVQKIQKVLKARNLSDITVGSVEEFQGQERKVIIISTVRSDPEFLTMDATNKLGFLRNPKRFNVAITRAKALLIVVGNPFVLSQDEHWNRFLEYCVAKGGYAGMDYDPSSDQLEDIIQRFDAIKLDDLAEMDKGDISAVDHIEEPAWRGET